MKYVLLDVIKNNLEKINDVNYLVLKSDAYGFGMNQILKLIKKTNLYKFCVINLEDAILIRKKIINAKILLITPFNKNDISIYKKYKIELSINDVSELEYIKDRNIKYQIVINSGMNRFGTKEIFEYISDENLVGIYSHNATNDEAHINLQIEKLRTVTSNYKNIDIHYFSSHLPNLNFGNCRRIGELIYKDCLIIKAKVIHYNFVKKGEYVGYDYTYKAKSDCVVGVLDIGYADGLSRMCNGFEVYSNSKFYELIGKSCMNHCFVLLDDTNVDEVEIISRNNVIENYEEFFKLSKHEIFINYSLSKNKYI